MRRGMARMDIKQRLKAHRTLILILTFLALVGWGAFAYSAGSSAIATHDLRAELAQLQASQDQLLAERNQQQAAAGDLAQLQAKLASTRQDLDTPARQREQARAQVATTQQELMVLTKRRDEKQAKVSEKGSVRGTKPSSKPARLAAQAKHQT